MSQQPDLVVIGGGSGGIAAAKRAARHGAKVVLVEAADLGGTCVNRGCVPKKLLWQTAKHWQDRQGLARSTGTEAGALQFAPLMTSIHDHISGLHRSFEDQLDDKGVQLLRDRASVRDDGSVRIGDETLDPRKVLVATGATPDMPDIEGKQHISASDDVFGWTSLPKSLLIVGGGYIGAEFASIFNALGVQVTLMQMGERILPRFDETAVQIVTDALRHQGVTFVFDAKPTTVSQTDDGYVVALDVGETHFAERVVYAIGRSANLSCMEGDNLETADTGALEIDRDFQTSRDGLYAIGDAANRLPLTPVATRDGESFADRAFGDGAEPIDLSLVATAAFTLPSVAQIGELDGSGADGTTGALQSAIFSPDTEMTQYHRIDFDGARLAGAVLVGESASDTIAPLAALTAASSAAKDAVAAATAIHPSVAEEFVGR